MDARWPQTLAEHGVAFSVLADGRLRLLRGDSQVELQLQIATRPPRPSEIQLAARPTLLAMRSISDAAARRLDERGWSYVTDDGRLHIASWGDLGEAPAQPSAAHVQDNAARKWSVGLSRVVHALLLHAERLPVQKELARLAGVSQPFVSQSLAVLEEAGLAARQGRSFVVDDPGALLETWRERRRFSPISTFWAHTSRDLAEVLGLFASVAETNWLVSGDVAADAQHPWKVPRRLDIYASKLDTRTLPFAQVIEPSEATLAVHVTTDPVVLSSQRRADWRGVPIRSADPVQTWWDLDSAIDVDAHESARRWRSEELRELL